MSFKPWKATIYILASTPDDDIATDAYADKITDFFENIREIGGHPVMMVKVPDLEICGEEEFDDA